MMSVSAGVGICSYPAPKACAFPSFLLHHPTPTPAMVFQFWGELVPAANMETPEGRGCVAPIRTEAPRSWTVSTPSEGVPEGDCLPPNRNSRLMAACCRMGGG